LDRCASLGPIVSTAAHGSFWTPPPARLSSLHPRRRILTHRPQVCRHSQALHQNPLQASGRLKLLLPQPRLRKTPPPSAWSLASRWVFACSRQRRCACGASSARGTRLLSPRQVHRALHHSRSKWQCRRLARKHEATSSMSLACASPTPPRVTERPEGGGGACEAHGRAGCALGQRTGAGLEAGPADLAAEVRDCATFNFGLKSIENYVLGLCWLTK